MNKLAFNAFMMAHEQDCAEREGELVSIDLDREQLYKLMLMAELDNITLNDFVNNILKRKLDL